MGNTLFQIIMHGVIAVVLDLKLAHWKSDRESQESDEVDEVGGRCLLQYEDVYSLLKVSRLYWAYHSAGETGE